MYLEDRTVSSSVRKHFCWQFLLVVFVFCIPSFYTSALKKKRSFLSLKTLIGWSPHSHLGGCYVKGCFISAGPRWRALYIQKTARRSQRFLLSDSLPFYNRGHLLYITQPWDGARVGERRCCLCTGVNGVCVCLFVCSWNFLTPFFSPCGVLLCVFLMKCYSCLLYVLGVFGVCVCPLACIKQNLVKVKLFCDC